MTLPTSSCPFPLPPYQVEELTESIQSIQQELRTCLRQRTELETKKNNLENSLNDNLLKTQAEHHRELEEISLSDRNQQLEMTGTELQHLEATITQNQERYGGKNDRVSCMAWLSVSF